MKGGTKESSELENGVGREEKSTGESETPPGYSSTNSAVLVQRVKGREFLGAFRLSLTRGGRQQKKSIRQKGSPLRKGPGGDSGNTKKFQFYLDELTRVEKFRGV